MDIPFIQSGLYAETDRTKIITCVLGITAKKGNLSPYNRLHNRRNDDYL